MTRVQGDQTMIARRPPDPLKFVSMEHEQFLVSMAKYRDEYTVLCQIHGLYDAATSGITVHENEVAIFQLLSFTHYHFLFATASLMRCHLSEAFASARVAIDGALIGAQIIHDRASQVAYTKRQKPFDKLARHLRNLVRDGKPLPHRLVPDLLALHDKISQFASHADVYSFVHRVREEGPGFHTFEYFQIPESATEHAIHFLSLLHTFVMVLDVFSDFLVQEQKVVPVEWQERLHGLGGAIADRCSELRATLPTEEIEDG